MRRLALLALVLGVALLAGTAGADTFAVVPSTPTFAVVPTSAAASMPVAWALAPNVVGTVAMPFDLSLPPAVPVQLSYPQLLSLWQRAGATYGIPWQVLASINKVESNFGRNMGPSSAGAVGWMQFMPDTWARWGMDANGDGLADPWNPDDAIFSAARYLAAAGGQADINRGVYAYNHADWYVNEVLGLANVYASSTGVVLSLDHLQMSLDAARKDVVDASTRLIAAQKVLLALRKDVAVRSARAERAPLLSDRLTLEAVAGRVGFRRDAAAAVVDRRKQTLASAREELDRAQQQSAASSFTPATSELFGAPSYSSGYVFPVGGGPGLVTASHTHHDYPAVDIAAPMGSPLYALADSIVLRSWSTPDARCGIGMTLQAFDGQVWTYCHLSVLDTNIVPGAQLKAGDPVGLVGATGHATGPHLHLQLQPATAWPQQEAWFQSFAGTAFTWSDTGANDGSTAGPIAAPTLAVIRTLAVVPTATTPVERTLAMVAETTQTAVPDLALGGSPVFEVAPAGGSQPSAGGVVYFSRPGS